jgi:hypothetical protein
MIHITLVLPEFLDKNSMVIHNRHSLNERRDTMGRSATPTHRVESTVNVGSIMPMAWNCKQNGRATEDNLEKWRRDYNESFQPGGVNGPRNGTDVILHISSARLVHQSTGRIVAETKAPMFEVV